MDIDSLKKMNPSERQELMRQLAEIDAKAKADAALEAEKKKKAAVLEAENGGKLSDLAAKRDGLASEINALEAQAAQLKTELDKGEADVETELKALNVRKEELIVRKERLKRRRNTEWKDLLSDIRHKKTELETTEKEIGAIQKVQSTPPVHAQIMVNAIPPHAQQVLATARPPIRQRLVASKIEQNGDGSSSTSKRSPIPATTEGGGSIGSSLDENDPPGQGFDPTIPIPPKCGLANDPSGIERCLCCFMAVNLAKMSNYNRHKKTCEAMSDLEIMGEREKNRGLTVGRRGKRAKPKPANEFEDVQPSKKIKPENKDDDEDTDGRSISDQLSVGDGGIEDGTNGGIELQGAVIITNGADGAVGLIPNVIVNNTTNDNSANVETGPKNVEAIEAKPHETSPKKVETIEANPNPEKVEENETKPDDDESSFFFGTPPNYDRSISEVTHPKYAPSLLETEDPKMAMPGTSEVKEEKKEVVGKATQLAEAGSLSSLIEMTKELAKKQGKTIRMVFD